MALLPGQRPPSLASSLRQAGHWQRTGSWRAQRANPAAPDVLWHVIDMPGTVLRTQARGARPRQFERANVAG